MKEKDKAVSTFNNTADSLQQQYSETLKGQLNLKIDEIVPERPSNNAFAWPKMEFFTHIPLFYTLLRRYLLSSLSTLS
jgi:hypothetical protein